MFDIHKYVSTYRLYLSNDLFYQQILAIDENKFCIMVSQDILCPSK